MSDADKSRVESRRRLIKSAAAAPIVFTLPTGSALAATSLSCQTKGLDRFEPTSTPAVVASDGSYTSDGWVRARLQSYNFRVDGDSPSDRSNGFTLNGTNYFKVVGGTASAVFPEFDAAASVGAVSTSHWGNSFSRAEASSN